MWQVLSSHHFFWIRLCTILCSAVDRDKSFAIATKSCSHWTITLFQHALTTQTLRPVLHITTLTQSRFYKHFETVVFMNLFHYLVASSFWYIILLCDYNTQQSFGRANIYLYFVYLYSEQNPCKTLYVGYTLLLLWMV